MNVQWIIAIVIIVTFVILFAIIMNKNSSLVSPSPTSPSLVSPSPTSPSSTRTQYSLRDVQTNNNIINSSNQQYSLRDISTNINLSTQQQYSLQ